MNNKEFSEISPAGGTFEFIINGDGKSISFGYRGVNVRALHGLRVTLKGKILGFLALGGIGRQKKEPDFEFPVLIPSDLEGLFGRNCPSCGSYFRTLSVGEFLHCPYCGIVDRLEHFLTENQKLFVKKQIEMAREAINKKVSLELNLDSIIADLPKNRPPWFIVENKQQNIYDCPKCQNKFDVLGEYGSCPHCGEENFLDLLRAKMERVKMEMSDQIATKKIAEHDVPANMLNNLVSTFEAMSNFIKRRLALIPMTPKRRKELEKLSFQRIKKAAESLKAWFGIELFKSLNGEDSNFIHLMFQRRHLFIHNNGQVDEKYLEETNDLKVTLNQILTVCKDEVIRLHGLLDICGKNLFDEYRSIK